MTVGGYQMETHHNGLGVTVSQYEAGWSFYLQGEDAAQFLEEWDAWQEDHGNNFRDFLSAFEYDTLFQ